MSKDWEKLWEAICMEFKHMEEYEVWTLVRKSEKPEDKSLVGNKWVFKIKDDERYRARTVAKGFSQIAGKDFKENHSPIMNDVTFRIVLVLKIMT